MINVANVTVATNNTDNPDRASGNCDLRTILEIHEAMTDWETWSKLPSWQGGDYESSNDLRMTKVSAMARLWKIDDGNQRIVWSKEQNLLLPY